MPHDLQRLLGIPKLEGGNVDEIIVALTRVVMQPAHDVEQLRQALSVNPEARYSREELSIAQAFEDLPDDMRRRLSAGEKTGE